ARVRPELGARVAARPGLHQRWWWRAEAPRALRVPGPALPEHAGLRSERSCPSGPSRRARRLCYRATSPGPVRRKRWSSRMYPFFDLVVEPVLAAAEARRVLEIGALRGATTSRMLETLGPDAE